MMNMNIERYQHNIEVLKQFKSGTCSTDLLKSYTGWGGLREAIYTPAVYHEIKKVLTPDEIISLKKTLNNAYYTPREMVAFMYDFLLSQGFTGGHILEPAIGTGVFVEHMPAQIRKASRITAIEIDKVTAKICKGLYPDVNLHITGFEEFHPTEKYDLIIGNPPYGAQTVTDNHHADLKDYCIHHYFVAKSMRLLKQGGILAMVLPSYFLDNDSKHVRNIIDTEGGELIAAYRLPDDLFADAKVTVDIVFLRKGKSANAPAWLNTRKKFVDGRGMSLNEYYHKNAHHIIGKLAVVDMYHRKGLTCKKEGNDTFQKLNQFIEKNPKGTLSNDNSALKALKAQMSQLCQGLNKLSQAFTETQQSIVAIHQKIAALEGQL